MQSYIRKGIAEGAGILVGGEGHPKGLEAGTVLTYRLCQCEQQHDDCPGRDFRPVLSVVTYDSEDEAIRIANDSRYGLHASVFGTDLQRPRHVASEMRAGRVVINA